MRKHKLLAVLLALTMTLSLLPTAALAVDETEPADVAVAAEPASEGTSAEEPAAELADDSEGDGTKESPYVVETAEALIAAVSAGGYIELADDITVTSKIEITKSVIIDGSKKTGSGSSNGTDCYSITIDGGDRVFNVNGENTLTFPLNIDFQNVQVIGPTTGTYTRGLSVWGANGDVNITLDNVKLTANYYALNIAGGNTDVEVNITDSTLEGWCALQTWSSDAQFTISDSVLRGINDKTYNAEGWNDFATIVVNEGVSGAKIDIFGSEIAAETTAGNFQQLFSIRAADNAVNLKGCTLSAAASPAYPFSEIYSNAATS